MKRLLALTIALTLPSIATAQHEAVARLVDSARVEIDRAVIKGDVAAIVAARGLLERAATADPKDSWVQHYIGYTWYREAILRGQRDKADPKQALDQARNAFTRSIELKPIPESHALLSAVLGQSIGSNPLKGMTLGPKSDAQMDAAIKLGPGNPRVWLLNGIGALFKPAMFGGGLDKAEAHLARAAKLFDVDKPIAMAPAWGHAETYAWLGQVRAKQKDPGGARAMYAKALAIEPENGWVKYVLLPALDKPASK